MKSAFAEDNFNFSLNVAEKDFAAGTPPLVQGLRALSPSINESQEGATGFSLQSVAAPHFKYCL